MRMLTTTAQSVRRRRFSPKRSALGRAFGKSWREVALEWDAREDLTLRQIADAWTRAVAASDPSIRFIPQDVSKTIRLAKSERLGVPA